jgi:hypothetical protein
MIEFITAGLQLGGNLYSAFSGMDMWSSEEQRIGEQIRAAESKKSDIRIAGEKQKDQLVDMTSEKMDIIGSKYGNIFEQINQEAASASSQTGLAYGRSDVMAGRKKDISSKEYNLASGQTLDDMSRGIENVQLDVDQQIDEANRMIEVLKGKQDYAQSMSGDFLGNFFG